MPPRPFRELRDLTRYRKALVRARTTGKGAHMEIAQSDAAAAMDWLRSETYKAYERVMRRVGRSWDMGRFGEVDVAFIAAPDSPTIP